MNELTEHKREMFDGMRAYHQSEISHANNAITMLLAISGAAGAVVLAMLFPQTTPKHLSAIAWGLFIVTSVLALAVALTTHHKINADHEVYAKYGAGYAKTCNLIESFKMEVEIEGKKTTIKEYLDLKESIGQGKGHRKTQAIIWTFAGVLIVLTLFFAICHPQ